MSEALEVMQAEPIDEVIPTDTEAEPLDSTEAALDEAVNEASEDLPEDQSIDSLKEEIATLKAQIAEFEAINESQTKILAELGEFTELFPDTPVSSIPDSVWDSVRAGAPLLASYALYEKRLISEKARIERINAENASRSPGMAGQNTAGEYFTPDEVRKMTPSEVHANYSKIKESMKKWIK